MEPPPPDLSNNLQRSLLQHSRLHADRPPIRAEIENELVQADTPIGDPIDNEP